MLKPEVILSEKQLQQCLAKWQRILRLQDWDVSMTLVRHSSMSLSNAAGEISVFPPKRQATVQILHPEDFHLAFGQNRHNNQDMEYTVVHELLHIHLNPWKTKGVEDEQVIHSLASALVQCNRGIWS